MSRETIELGGGFQIGPAGLVAVLGEADAGEPGATETNIRNNRFSGDQVIQIRDKYRSGPIVDAANFLFAPAADGAIPSGANTVWIYKTNSSERASLELANSYGTVESIEYGVGGNRITYQATLVEESPALQQGAPIAFAPVAEVTEINFAGITGASLDAANGKYWTLSSANDATQYYVWYRVTDGTPPADPSPAGLTGVSVDVLLADTAADLASKTLAVLNALADFSVAPVASSVIEVTNTAAGEATSAADVDTGAVITVTTEGDSADGSALNSVAFGIRIAGGAATASVILSSNEADHDSITDLVAEISAQLPAGMSVADGGAGNLEISLDAVANSHRLGYSRGFELIDSNPGDLAKLGLTAGMVRALVEPSVTIKLDQKRDQIQEEEELGGAVVLEIGNSSASTQATVSVTAENIELKENSVVVHSLLKSSFATLSQIASEINLKTGWTAAVSDAVYNQLSPSTLDIVTDVGAFSTTGEKPAALKRDASDVAEFFELAQLAQMKNQSVTGLPDAEGETSLAGGLKGGTSTSEIVNALDKFTKFHVNFIVPLFSRDAVSDISDGLTDPTSNYTIDGIHQAVKTHISLMKSTKKKSERQGYLSLKDTFANCKTRAGDLGDERLQLMIQDVRQIDAAGNIKWFQPWAFSAILAGARSGAPIGEPMTFKFMNVSGIRQTAQPMSTPEEDIVVDFDPDLQVDEAIQSGITFMEEAQNGGFRVVVDNTTYGVDDNFLRNRANVRFAADIVLFNYRQGLERFIGRKNTVSVADIAAAASSILAGFLNQGITVSTEDAPQGFKQLTVRLEGNIIITSVTIKIVEGIDFVLSDINIQRATASA